MGKEIQVQILQCGVPTCEALNAHHLGTCCHTLGNCGATGIQESGVEALYCLPAPVDCLSWSREEIVAVARI